MFHDKYILPFCLNSSSKETKPCCVVDCHWEDISFRLDPMNMLRNIAQRLERNINVLELAIKLNIKVKAQESEIALLIIKILDHFIGDCRFVINSQLLRYITSTKSVLILGASLMFYDNREQSCFLRHSRSGLANLTFLWVSSFLANYYNFHARYEENHAFFCMR